MHKNKIILCLGLFLMLMLGCTKSPAPEELSFADNKNMVEIEGEELHALSLEFAQSLTSIKDYAPQASLKVTSSSVTVTYAQVPNVKYFYGLYILKEDNTHGYVSATLIDDYEYTLNGLQAGRTYRLVLFLRDSANSESVHVYKDFTATQTETPVKPKLTAPVFKSIIPSEQSVEIEVSKVENATHYNYAISENINGSYKYLTSKTNPNSYIVFSALKPLTEYKIKIFALADGYESSSAIEKVFVTKALPGSTKPVKLSTPTVASIESSSSSITVKMNPVAYGEKYFYGIYMMNSDGSAGFVGAVLVDQTSYTFSNLKENQLYKLSLHVRAEGIENSDTIFVSQKTTTNTAPPPTKETLAKPTIISSSVTTNSASITINAVTKATSYNYAIYKLNGTSAEYVTSKTTSSLTGSFTSLSEDTTYQLRVYALADGFYNSEVSTKDVRTKLTPTLSPPKIIEQTSELNSVSVKIDPVLYATSYNFAIYKKVESSYNYLTSKTTNSTTGTFSGLESGTEYKVRVYALANGYKNSAYTNALITTKSPSTPPVEPTPPPSGPMPSKLATPVVKSISSAGTSLTVEIYPVPYAEKYFYGLYIMNPDGSAGYVNAVLVAESKYIFTNLLGDRTYKLSLHVRAAGIENSDTVFKEYKMGSNPISEPPPEEPTPPPPAPQEPAPTPPSGPAPTKLTPPSVKSISSQGSNLTVEVNPVDYAQKYFYGLYILNSDGSAGYINAVLVPETKYTFSNLLADRTYKLMLHVRAEGIEDSENVFKEYKMGSGTIGEPTPPPAPEEPQYPQEPQIPQDGNGKYVTLEQYGGKAYYKRFDEKLSYTPKSDGTTLITYEGNDNVFTTADQGMMFAGLFAHRNPPIASNRCGSEYYPGLVGTRYSKVIKVVDGKNIIVNFQYNGGNSTSPVKITNGKGYIFFDNSNAYYSMMNYFFSADSDEEEIRLAPYSKNGILSTVYVIPSTTLWNTTDKNVKIWTGSTQKARVKLGVEDYFKWKNHESTDKNIICYKQTGTLFDLKHWNRNFVIHNVDLLPPHRRVVETEVARMSLFRNDFYKDDQKRIIAVINSLGLAEKREIGSSLTEERFFTIGIGTINGRGSYSGSGVARDVSDYFYLLIKNSEHSGGGYMEYKASGGAAAYLVTEDLNISFDDNLKKIAFATKARFSRDKSGFPAEIQAATHYNSHVAQVDDAPFYLINTYNNMDGFSSHNRGNLLHIDRFTFTLPNRAYWANVHDEIFSEGHATYPWNLEWGNTDEFTAYKHLIYAIPEKGKRYRISRHYDLLSGRNFPAQYNLKPNQIRNFINYSVVFNKSLDQIDPKSIPANAKPIEFQAGDQFKIVGRGDTVYTIIEKDRTEAPSWAWEIISAKATHYAYSMGTLDKNLPSDLPLDFDIEMVNSTSEYLLDGQPRNAYIIFKANFNYRTNINTKFGDYSVMHGEPVGHNFYNHREVNIWANNTKIESGFFRQSSNELEEKTQYQFKINDPDNGAQMTTAPLLGYAKRIDLINTSGFKDQFGGYFEKMFSTRDKIERSLGMNIPASQKAKLRLYNSPNNNSQWSGAYLETYPTSENAPEMPVQCRTLIEDIYN